tara:strand:+ start:371 stop:733 length:363 start_codon:yes stop_codon:yes gene_type:complete
MYDNDYCDEDRSKNINLFQHAESLPIFNKQSYPALIGKLRKTAAAYLIYAEIAKVNNSIKTIKNLAEKYQWSDDFCDITELKGFNDHYPFNKPINEMTIDWCNVTDFEKEEAEQQDEESK